MNRVANRKSHSPLPVRFPPLTVSFHKNPMVGRKPIPPELRACRFSSSLETSFIKNQTEAKRSTRRCRANAGTDICTAPLIRRRRGRGVSTVAPTIDPAGLTYFRIDPRARTRKLFFSVAILPAPPIRRRHGPAPLMHRIVRDPAATDANIDPTRRSACARTHAHVRAGARAKGKSAGERTHGVLVRRN